MRKFCLAATALMVLALVLPACSAPVEEDDAIQAELASMQQQYQTAQAQITSLQSDLASKSSALASKSASLDEAQNSISTLKGTIAILENELRATLDTVLPQYYQFGFQARSYSWTLPVPLRSYLHYKDKPRLTETSKYSVMVGDDYSDNTLNVLIDKIKETALNYNLKQTDIINMVSTFTQNLVNANKNVQTPLDEYPRYPVETLVEQGGDSEDNSILAAALLNRLGFKVVFFVFEQPQHVALGIDIPGAAGTSWEHKATKYYYLETTGERFQFGECPNIYATSQPAVITIE